MGTLKDHPPRRETQPNCSHNLTILSEDARKILLQALDISNELDGVSLPVALEAIKVASIIKANDYKVTEGDYMDENLAGLGECIDGVGNEVALVENKLLEVVEGLKTIACMIH